MDQKCVLLTALRGKGCDEILNIFIYFQWEEILNIFNGKKSLIFLAQGPLSAWVLALAQISQPQASICFVVARIPLRGSQEELAAAQSGEKPKYL